MRAASGGMNARMFNSFLDGTKALDGASGSAVWGRLMPAADSLARDALPISLAAGAMLTWAVEAGETAARADVELQVSADVLAVGQDMERSLSYARSVDR